MTYLRRIPFDEKDFPAFAGIKEELGFLPNFFQAQVSRPDLIESEINLTAGILIKGGALTRRQKEYIFLECSAANGSTYCVNAHCSIFRRLGLEGPEPEQIALDRKRADVSDTDAALLDFCTKLNTRPSAIGPADVETLRTLGFSEQQILEAVLTVAWAKFSNTVGSGLGLIPDFENLRIEEALDKRRIAAKLA
jgi:uncharacterized peroxidase-related enzyme